MRNNLKVLNTKSNKDVNIWAWSCPHLNADLLNGRNSITDAIGQIEGDDGFEYDFSICAGDFDSSQTPPDVDVDASHGVDIVNSLAISSKNRGHHYSISGNHDGAPNMEWFLRYIDPLGDNTSYSNVSTDDMPYKQHLMEDGSWHSYYIEFGNNLILFISDRNDLPYPYGRDGAVDDGGYPSGAITLKTWNWMKKIFTERRDKNIFVITHMNPRNTTMGTGDYEGVDSKLHGPSGIPAGSGSIYSIYDEDNPELSINEVDDILTFFRNNPNHTVVAWMAGHSHTYLDETYNGRNDRYTESGVTYLNIGHLTVYHTHSDRPLVDPMSMLMTITNKDVIFRLFLHKPADGNPIGFYDPRDLSIPLKV